LRKTLKVFVVVKNITVYFVLTVFVPSPKGNVIIYHFEGVYHKLLEGPIDLKSLLFRMASAKKPGKPQQGMTIWSDDGVFCIPVVMFTFMLWSLMLVTYAAAKEIEPIEDTLYSDHERQCIALERVSREKQMCSVNRSCSHRSTVGTTENNCPVWFQCSSSGMCECYPTRKDNGVVRCNANLQIASVVDCSCVTYSSKYQDMVVGHCLENCAHPHTKDLVDNVYHHLPKPSQAFNEEVCYVSHRTGVLCGQCRNDSYPLVYSYNHSCIPSEKCGSTVSEVAKYILAAYGPLTVFFLIVLLFQINITSSYLHGFCIFSQALTIPGLVRVILSATFSNSVLSMVIKIFVSFFAIWNLDFFRSFYNESICFQIQPMTMAALNYLIAVFPLLLSIASYYLVELYDQRIKLIVYLWCPIKYMLSFFHNKWNKKTSVVDAYATFFLLSYLKVLESSFNLLTPTKLHHMASNQTTLVLYYDGSVEYFSHKHLPYAIIAIAFFASVNVLPIVVLLLYQCSFFQALLSKLPLRLDILHTFMDLLQGCYKNGATPNTRDLRWFPAVFLICRILLFVLFALTQDGMFFVYGTIISFLTQALIMLVRPFKQEFSHFTQINSLFSMFLTLVYACIVGINIAAIVEKGGIIIEFYFVSAFTVLIPVAYMCGCTCHWLVTHCKLNIRYPLPRDLVESVFQRQSSKSHLLE